LRSAALPLLRPVGPHPRLLSGEEDPGVGSDDDRPLRGVLRMARLTDCMERLHDPIEDDWYDDPGCPCEHCGYSIDHIDAYEEQWAEDARVEQEIEELLAAEANWIFEPEIFSEPPIRAKARYGVGAIARGLCGCRPYCACCATPPSRRWNRQPRWRGHRVPKTRDVRLGRKCVG